jgi:hypothetical protein
MCSYKISSHYLLLTLGYGPHAHCALKSKSNCLKIFLSYYLLQMSLDLKLGNDFLRIPMLQLWIIYCYQACTHVRHWATQ